MTCLCDGDGERLECFSEDFYRSRKERGCSECGATIRPGDRYHVAKGVAPGHGWWSAVHCAPCGELILELQRECDHPMFGDVLADLLHDFRAEDLDTLPPHLAGHVGGLWWQADERSYDRRQAALAERRRAA